MSLLASVFADISIQPDLNGLPPIVHTGLVHLTNNLAAIVLLISALGLVVSLAGLVIGHQLHNHQLTERSRTGLGVSISAGAILYLGVAAANYATGLFR